MLNDKQRQAVDCEADKILVLAGAGTGKTTTMISRISRLIDDGVSPDSILVLTFTNAVACEMKERYRKDNNDKQIPTFCTFHSYCYSLLAKSKTIRNHLGYYKNIPNIADEKAIKRIKTICKQQCGINLSEDKLNGKVQLKSKEKFPYQLFWKHYDKLLCNENLISFDKLCYGVSQLFSENNPMVYNEKERYKYIFVDEFQDTDPKQWKFVLLFENSKLFVVGDAKQAIYQFRNGDSKIIKSLAKNPDWTTIQLSENYRSTKQICNYANKIHSNWKGQSYNLNITSKKDGLEVLECPAISFENQYENEKDIAQIIHDFNNYKSIAILTRTNFEADKIKAILQFYNIPFRGKQTETITIGILKSALDTTYCVDWLSSQLPQEKYIAYLKACAINSDYKNEADFFELYREQFSNKIKLILQVREILRSNNIQYQKMSDIAKLFHLSYNTDFPDKDDNKSIIEFLIQLADTEIKSEAIYVGTIHSVKGLEFDCVHLVGVNSKSFPVNQSEENQNLFYVGVTRAKEKLVIFDSNKK